MKTSKSEVPTIFYPEEHDFLAEEMDKVLRKKKVKENLSKIDTFLAQLVGAGRKSVSTGRPRRKR